VRKAALAALAVLLLASCSGNAGSAPVPAPVPSVAPLPDVGRYIKHVVVIVQENRSFEQLFAGWPGADAPLYGTMSTGQRVRLRPMPFEESQDIDHLWRSAMLEWNHGKMDRFDLDHFGTLGTGPLVGRYTYSYIDPSQLGPYRAMARQYVLGDHFFPTEFGTSFTAHQDLIAGRTQIDPLHSLVDTPTLVPWGCDAPQGTTTSLIDPQRRITTNGPFPCFNQYETIADRLDAAGLSWRYYTQSLITFGGEVWNAFDAIARVRNGPDWTRSVIIPDLGALTDPAHGKLAAVTWVIPDAAWSDHPAVATDYGPSWVGDVVNGIGTSHVLERYRHHRDLGRLGRFLRQRSPAATRLLGPGHSHADLDRLALREGRLRDAHAVRIRQHPEVHRTSLRPAVAARHRRPREQPHRQLRFHASAPPVQAHPDDVSTEVLHRHEAAQEPARRRLSFGRSSRAGQDGGGFDFDHRARFEQAGDLYERHRRIDVADDLPVSNPEIGGCGLVLGFVGHVPRHADQIGRRSTGRAQHRNHVAQRLRRLFEQPRPHEFAPFVPSDLARDRQHPPVREHAVGIAARTRPAARIDRLAHA